MTSVHADIEAIQGLRAGLHTFAARQVDTLRAAESEMHATQSALDAAEQRWRYRVERRRAALASCYREAAQAAYDGYGGVDCYPLEQALAEAEAGLTRVLRAQAQVDQAIVAYRGAAARLEAALSTDLPRARSFLADRITALEAYHAAHVLASVSALAGAGVPGVMGAAIGALRASRGQVSQVMGAVGEQAAAQVLSERFGLEEVPFDQPKHGFDRVFRAPGIPLMVMESKVSSDGALHLGQTQAGEQGSPAWIAATTAQMADRDSAQWSPANERIARLVQDMGPENVPALSVVVHPASGLTDIYTRQESGDWRLLEGAIAPQPLPPRDPTHPPAPPESREGGVGGTERRG